MTTLLHINASARTSRSLTRHLSQAFVDTWLLFRPSDEVIDRDVGRFPPPPISENWISAAFTKPEMRTPEQNQILALSDALVSELTRADIIVFATPMYNYGMPSALKAWVDQVIRIDKTFTFDLARGDFPLEPILTGKTLVLLSASGEFGFEPGGIREHMNHLDSHIRAIKHYLGAVELHHVAIEYQEFGGELHTDSIKTAHKAATLLARKLAEAARSFQRRSG
ncbi:FMN-dependent NADH-azoreductase [Candidatus Phyllobacterium onerii]|uniref:FMN-dependent NADH-azoreductase n=1 Tax=Candidatus Phyllobacterium onerii TaxID=3020828 RepID=UPI00232B5EB6|nr:NAD(P)H-dependent oxidoreductase [Phyllobacterium sp. IY22]